MNYNGIDLKVLVKDRPITEYFHRGQTFVEGRASSNYEIQISNNNNHRVEAVLSVDGLSVIDGKMAGPQSSGYLVEANSSITVPGWTLDNEKIAKFAFSGKNESYATEMTGDSRNNGVIGVMVFSEKYQYQAPHYYGGTYMPFTSVTSISSGVGGGSVSDWNGLGAPRVFGSVNYSNQIVASAASPAFHIAPQAMNMSSPSVSETIIDQSFIADSSIVEQSLGTSFGESAKFQTTTVEFKRGDHLATVVLYYDDLRGLRQRGVPIERTKKKQYKSRPQAFPADVTGCKPPKNWKG